MLWKKKMEDDFSEKECEFKEGAKALKVFENWHVPSVTH